MGLGLTLCARLQCGVHFMFRLIGTMGVIMVEMLSIRLVAMSATFGQYLVSHHSPTPAI